MFMLPLFIRGFGSVVIMITFITALSTIPFEKRFQGVTVMTIFSTCLGPLIGNALLYRLFKATVQKNGLNIGANLDSLDTSSIHITMAELYDKLQIQTLIVSMKELYGLLAIIGIFIMMGLFLKSSTLRPVKILPKFRKVRRRIRHVLKMDKILIEE